MIVMLGGSRHLNLLPDEVLLRLDAFVEQEADFVVGDAPGVDTILQRFLADRGVGSVTVYSSAPEIRANLRAWPTCHVESGLKSRSAAMHTAKDRAMSKIAGTALMLWDGKSAGTLANAIDVAERNGDVYMYVDPTGDFRQFEAGEGLIEWASEFPEPLAEATKRLAQFTRRAARQAQGGSSNTDDDSEGNLLF